MSNSKRDAAYWRYRVERDYPDIALRLQSGEIPSVRAAAIQAGLLRPPTAIDELRRAWRKASATERSTFIDEIAPVAGLATAAGARDAKRKNGREATHDQPIDQGELFRDGRAAAANDSAALPSVAAPPRMAPDALAVRAPRRASVAIASQPAAASQTDIRDNDHVPFQSDRLVSEQIEAPQFGSVAERQAMPADMIRENGSHRNGARERAQYAAAAPSPANRAAALRDAYLARAQSAIPAAPFDDDTVAVRRLAAPAPPPLEPAAPPHREPHRDLPDDRELRRWGVAVGQHFIKLDAGPDPWEVLSVFAGPGEMPHARIVKLAEPDLVRVVSLAALTNRRHYRRA